MKEYYSQRASAGLIISEATAISEAGSGWRNAPHISSETHAMEWKNIVDAVHDKGGLIYCQLWHQGRQAHSSHHPSTGKTFSASEIPMNGKVKTIYGEEVDGEVPHALSVDEIQETIQDYVKAARFSKMAGFDGIEIHGANGYLLDQFMQSCSNVRTDNYGGSMENRFRIVGEIIDAIAADGSYPVERIGFRISPNGAFGGMGSEDNPEMFAFVASELNKKKIGYLHVMDGLGFGYHGKAPPVKCATIRKHFDGAIFCNVGLTRDVAEGMVRSGAADAAVFGRLYMSNPDLPERFANDWPLEEPAPYETWWGPTGAKGYTDFPRYKEENDASEAQ